MLALPVLIELAALLLALGFILAGKQFIDALLWIVKKVTRALPLSGFLIGAVAEVALQKLSNEMGKAANNVGASVSASWHFLATIVDRVAWTTFHLAVAVNRMFAYITVGYPLHILWATAKRAEQLALHAGKSIVKSEVVTKIIRTTITVPAHSALAPAIRAITKPLAAELHRFEAWARHEIAIAGGAAVAVPVRVGYTWKQLRSALSRLRKLEKATAGAGAVALVATALARMGLSWIRCRQVKKAGRAICGMNPSVFESILLDASLLTVAFNIETFARELQAITGEAAHLIHDFAE